MDDLAIAYQKALTDPKLEAMKHLEERMARIEGKLDALLDRFTTKMEPLHEDTKGLCVSTQPQSSPKHRRS